MKLTNTPYSHRRVLIISIAIFAIILVIPLFIIVTSKPAIVPQSVKNNLPAQTNNPFQNGSLTQQQTYSIAYPQGSQLENNTFTGGTTLIIQPPVSTYPGEPILDVEAYNSQQNLKEKEMWYLAAGAKSTTLSINNTAIPELSVMYQMRTINSKPIHTPTQLRIAYIVKPNALFVFRMYYSSSTTIQADEDLFADFIRSFTLTKEQ